MQITVTDPQPGARPEIGRFFNDVFLPLASLVLVVGVWWAAVKVFQLPLYLLPSPEVVFSRIRQEWLVLLTNSVATAQVAVAGLLCSLILGVSLGLVIARSGWARALLMPTILATQSVPKIALAPLLVVWLGFGPQPKLIVVLLITFFPIILGTIVGVQTVSLSMILLARSMGMKSWSLYRHIILPSAAPYIAASFRLASSQAIIGALFAEFVGSNIGLGNLLLVAIGTNDTVLAFAAVVVTSAVGLIIYLGATTLARLATIRVNPTG